MQIVKLLIFISLAMTEMVLAMAFIMSKFDFELADPKARLEWVAMPVMRPKDSKLMVKVSNRKLRI